MWEGLFFIIIFFVKRRGHCYPIILSDNYDAFFGNFLEVTSLLLFLLSTAWWFWKICSFCCEGCEGVFTTFEISRPALTPRLKTKIKIIETFLHFRKEGKKEKVEVRTEVVTGVQSVQSCQLFSGPVPWASVLGHWRSDSWKAKCWWNQRSCIWQTFASGEK